TGGCVCHQIGVQRELWSALDDIIARSQPDVLVLETTGIAEPFLILEGLAERTPRATAAVVTGGDAEAGPRPPESPEEARDQVIAADRILISKVDLAPAARLAELHTRLHALNAEAERAAFPDGATGTAALVPFLLDAMEAARWRRTAPAHRPASA